MPIYRYVCRSCMGEFDRLVMGQARPTCPSCGGEDLERRLSLFAVAAKAAREPAPAGSCGTCGDPRGPGACARS